MREIYLEEQAKKYVQGRAEELEELTDWVEKYLSFFHGKEAFTVEEKKHIVRCLQSLIGKLFDVVPCGDFVAAVIKNDLRGAACLADNTNKRVLDLYARFLLNYVPMEKLR